MTFTLQFLDGRRLLFVAVSVGAVGGIAWYYISRRRSVIQWEEVGHVSNLFIYPVKSAQPISVKSAMATKSGLANGNLADRSFMVVTEDLKMVTGRHCNKLVTMKTSFVNDKLTITSLSGEKVSLSIPDTLKNRKITKMKVRGDNVQGIDCGDNVAEWLSKQLYEDETRVRLMYAGLEKWKRPKLNFGFNFPGYVNDDTTLYNDTAAYMIMTESSLQDLNTRINDSVSMSFFRPPIVVSGTSPYEEDTWEHIKIGDSVVMHIALPCSRCKLTQVNPETGSIQKEHFEALLSYRTINHPPELAKNWKNNPIFGIYCGADSTGTIKVGDKVYISRNKSPVWHV